MIELLAVIAILAVLIGIAVPVVSNQISKSKEAATQQSISIVRDALERYALDHNGSYPTGGTPQNPETEDGTSGKAWTNLVPNYLQEVPKDGTGTPFKYYSDGTSFTITSSYGSVTFPSNSN